MIEADAAAEEGGEMVMGGTGTDMVVMSDAIASVLFSFSSLLSPCQYRSSAVCNRPWP